METAGTKEWCRKTTFPLAGGGGRGRGKKTRVARNMFLLSRRRRRRIVLLTTRILLRETSEIIHFVV